MPRKKKESDIPEIIQRVEYFDDRFYKIQVPNVGFPLEGVPANYIERRVDEPTDLYLPSVTTYLGLIIDSFLMRWRGDVGNERADFISWKARELGSEIHNVIDLRMKGYDILFSNRNNPISAEQLANYRATVNNNTSVINSQEVAVQLARFERVVTGLQPTIMSSEMTVFNIEQLYAGTCDQVWSFDEPIQYKQGRSDIMFEAGRYLVDIKTGRGINDRSYFAQLSAYANSDTLKHYGLKGAIILHLNANIKSGIEGVKLYYKSTEQLKPYYQYFLNVKDAFLFDQEIEPKKYEIPTVFNSKMKGV